MALRIGIVACSSEGAALCYRTICEDRGHPEVSMHAHPFAKYVECLQRGDWEGIAKLMLRSSEALARAGADFTICPDNTIHQALPYVQERLPLPWLHIADVVVRVARDRGFRRVGLTGTRWLVEGPVYPERFEAVDIAVERPSPLERDECNRIIMEELVAGVFRPESIAYVRSVISRMKADGCDAVVLGCTELPLIVGDANSSLPTLDSTRLLAHAAARAAFAAEV